jgi:predicted phosphohydrolase
MRLEDALPDLDRIGHLPGTKLLIKGNHDYWWTSLSKMKRALHPSIGPLQAGSIILNRVAVVGTRGWICPNDSHFGEQDAKIYERELGRLRAALDTLQGRRNEFDALIVALHYPPTDASHRPSGFIDLMELHRADVCVYGHLHGDDIKTALTGKRGQIVYYLVSADAADFAPAEIIIQ